jgi:hypothetical protein
MKRKSKLLQNEHLRSKIKEGVGNNRSFKTDI